jgi:hypothetical protein
MDGDADQLEREVADLKVELAAEVDRLRARALGVRRRAARRLAIALLVVVAGVALTRVRRHR